MQAKHSANSTPALKQLVLVGGGHSHLAVLTEFAKRPVPGLQIVLISEDTMTGYSGMLPGLISGLYSFEETHIDLRRLCQSAGVVFIKDRVLALDPAAQSVQCRQHGLFNYDWLSINTGSTPSIEGISDLSNRAIPVKPIRPFLAELERIAVEIEKRSPSQDFRIGVVGAGAAGVEVALSVQHRFQNQFPTRQIKFHLFSSDKGILPTHNPKVRACFGKILLQRDVQVHLGFKVSSVNDKGVEGHSGATQALDEVFLVTSSSPQTWLRESGLSADERGFVQVNDFMQSVSANNVFAAGDVAHMVGRPLEKAGVFAVRQGKPLAKNLKRSVLGTGLKPYRPQKKWLALISAGDRYAIASRGGLFASGAWLWKWKDQIDRKFMKMFQSFSGMAPANDIHIPQSLRSPETDSLLKNLSMRCTGCGSKVGSSVLTKSIERLQQSGCEQIKLGIDRPDDAAVFEVPAGQLLVQSLDYFSAPLDDPFLVGQLAAVHSLSDLHAMGSQPKSALAMVTLPLGSQEVMGQMLDQVLAGAGEVFSRENICLLGGHTTEGQQLVVGFSVNGFVEKEQLLKKQGVQVGDRLILTKPLGTGVLLAANMQLKAKGSWIDSMLEEMLVSNGTASNILAKYDVNACTDITGFGLMGHLAEMVKDCNVRLNMSLEALPIYEGALSLSEDGVQSTLYPENLKSRHLIGNLEQVVQRIEFPLLFDPQTAGGLLASVPLAQTESCLSALAEVGIAAIDLGFAELSVSGPEINWSY